MTEMEITLFEKYLQDRASEEEVRKVDNWLLERGFDRDDLKQLISPSDGLRLMLSIDAEKDWPKLKQRLPAARLRILNIPALRIAASLLLIAATTSIIYLLLFNSLKNTEGHFKTVENTGPSFIKEVLPDGSSVFLHSGSQVIYEENFLLGRKVSMTGQAFFEVKPDAAHPFSVKTQNAIVKVVGTSFQITELPGDVEVEVTTGKVSMESVGAQQVFLVKGERGIYHIGEKEISREQNNDLNYLSWKTGIIEFKNTPLNQVTDDLEAYFGVTITLNQQMDKLPAYTSLFEKPTLHEVLEEMKLALPIQYTISGKNIVLTRK